MPLKCHYNHDRLLLRISNTVFSYFNYTLAYVQLTLPTYMQFNNQCCVARICVCLKISCLYLWGRRSFETSRDALFPCYTLFRLLLCRSQQPSPPPSPDSLSQVTGNLTPPPPRKEPFPSDSPHLKSYQGRVYIAA